MSETTPIQQARQRIAHVAYAAGVWALAGLGVADALDDTALSAEELAGRAGVNADALERALRLVAGFGVFREVSAHTFAHTELSRLLRSDHPQSMLGMTHLVGLTLKLLQLLPETLRSGRPAAAMLAPGGIFEYLSTHPAEARIFDEAMTSKARIDTAAILAAYDFSNLSLIADVGGGRGHFIKAILARQPAARGILFDLPQVLGRGAEVTSERLTVQSGDFFRDPLPAADAYLLMNVIHDWPDAQAASILAAVRRAAPSKARLLVLERLMPEQPEPTDAVAHPAVVADFLMLLYTGGRERTRSQYERLFDAAGFRLSRVISTAVELSVLECRTQA